MHRFGVNGKASAIAKPLHLETKTIFARFIELRPIVTPAGHARLAGQGGISGESATRRPQEEAGKEGLEFGNWLGLAGPIAPSPCSGAGPRCGGQVFRRHHSWRWRSAPW